MIGWGIGPRFGAPCIAYGMVSVLLTHRFPSIFGFPDDARLAIGVLGGSLAAMGFAFYLVTVGWFLAARKERPLVTTGPFRLVRHPLYGTWLWLIYPGIALLCRSWLALGVIPIGYVAFRSFIKHEEDELERRFGREYETYRWEVNQIVPPVVSLKWRRNRTNRVP